MATISWSTRVVHDSDATFREWGSELEVKLAEAGLVQTSDTGQIDWTTATRSAINTLTAGYSIWRFDDSQQGTAPIYIKIDYGTGSTSTYPRAAITVGTGSDGSGTLTGTALTAQRVFLNASSTPSAVVARQSFLCVTEGFFGLVWKYHGEITSIGGGFFIARTVDSAGVPTATGAIVNWGGHSVTQQVVRQALRFASTAAAYTATGANSTAALGLLPQGQIMTVTGNDVQAALAFTITPRAEPINQVCGVLFNELNSFVTFETIMVGTVKRKYIVCPGQMGAFGPIDTGDSGALRVAMLWE